MKSPDIVRVITEGNPHCTLINMIRVRAMCLLSLSLQEYHYKPTPWRRKNRGEYRIGYLFVLQDKLSGCEPFTCTVNPYEGTVVVAFKDNDNLTGIIPWSVEDVVDLPRIERRVPYDRH